MHQQRRAVHLKLRVWVLLRDTEFDIELRESLDTGGHDIARLDCADSLGCAREDEVSFLQAEDGGDVADEGGEGEDLVGRVALLLQLPVHLQPQTDVLGIRNQRPRNHVGDRAESVVAATNGHTKYDELRRPSEYCAQFVHVN